MVLMEGLNVLVDQGSLLRFAARVIVPVISEGAHGENNPERYSGSTDACKAYFSGQTLSFNWTRTRRVQLIPKQKEPD